MGTSLNNMTFGGVGGGIEKLAHLVGGGWVQKISYV